MRRKRKIKVFNWIILISVIIFILYIIISLIMLLPIFKRNYSYNIKTENYEIKAQTNFKKNLFSCSTKEKYVVKADNDIKKALQKDLNSVGFSGKKNEYVKSTKNFGFCKKRFLLYKKVHSKNYVNYKLNGDSNVKINYGSDFEDSYVLSEVNNKISKDVSINSNYNKNVVGNYIIVYKLKVNNDYYRFLYRKVSVVDEENPVITLTGDENITLKYGKKYDELGCVATDNYDGNISSEVKISGNINEKKKGIYKIKYKVVDSSGNSATKVRSVTVLGKEINNIDNSEPATTQIVKPVIKEENGITYVNGILLVNKKYGLPNDYDPGVNDEAYQKLKQMQADAKALNLDLQLQSGYRSYARQTELYNNYVKKDGEEKASMYSAKPGHSEHQTGLAFDVGLVDSSFADTKEAKWLEQNCHLYGFIIRYPKDKTDITGYIYEPWHIRYLGVENATKVKESGLTLEEYLKIN